MEMTILEPRTGRVIPGFLRKWFSVETSQEKWIMTIVTRAEAKILAVVPERRCIVLEQLVASVPDLTWDQVFAIVDELSRRGVNGLRRRGFEYELRAWSPSAGRPVSACDYALSGSV